MVKSGLSTIANINFETIVTRNVHLSTFDTSHTITTITKTNVVKFIVSAICSKISNNLIAVKFFVHLESHSFLWNC